MRRWKPGDVVFVANDAGGFVGMADHQGLVNGFDRNGSEYTGRTVPAGRQLVVIDPEDREQVNGLLKAYGEQFTSWTSELDGGNTDRLQAALRSLATPPKPDEPQGLGAVVEDSEGDLWVRDVQEPGRDTAWLHAPGRSMARRRKYADISAVKILRDGVQP